MHCLKSIAELLAKLQSERLVYRRTQTIIYALRSLEGISFKVILHSYSPRNTMKLMHIIQVLKIMVPMKNFAHRICNSFKSYKQKDLEVWMGNAGNDGGGACLKQLTL